MKKIMTLVAAGLLTIGISSAQERGNRQNKSAEETAKEQVERLTQQLSLDKNQQDSVYRYALLANKEQRKLMESAPSNREATFEKMRELRANTDKKIKTFLNADQIKKFEEEIKKRPQGGGRRNN